MKKILLIILCSFLSVACSPNSESANKLVFSLYGSRSSNTFIDGEPRIISIDEYNHSTFFEFRNYNFFPKSIDYGNLKYFSYVEHCGHYVADSIRAEYYLEWNIGETGFISERNRIANLHTYSTTKSVVYSNNLFNKPSYIAIYNHQSEFLYSIIDENTFTIVYIYFIDVKSIDQLVFSESFKPTIMLNQSDFPENLGYFGYYNMYE